MGQTPTKFETESASKKRLFSELEADELFKEPLDDRFGETMNAIHNDEVKEPMTLKRAPLNPCLIEELELIRTNYKGKGDMVREEEAQLAQGIRFLKGVALPIFDKEQLQDLLESKQVNIANDVKLKIQEFISRGFIDDWHLLKQRPSMWEFLDKGEKEFRKRSASYEEEEKLKLGEEVKQS